MLSIVVSIINSWVYCEYRIKYNRILVREAILNIQQDFDPRDRKKYYLEETAARRFLLRLVRGLFSAVMVLKVEGRENLPLDGAVVIAANHVNNFDVFPIQFAIPRAICFMAKAELFNPLLDPLLRILCAFPVNRGEKDDWALRHAHKVLAHKQTLGMFPEGKRSKGGGLSIAKTGAARLALEMNCPIIPVAVIGTDTLFKRFPYRSHVTIKLLSPILPKVSDTALSLTDRMMFTLAAELPEFMRGVYAEIPKGFGR
jgi:1-acyl-sn-glycerol-3-phosphate acyltransferase